MGNGARRVSLSLVVVRAELLVLEDGPVLVHGGASSVFGRLALPSGCSPFLLGATLAVIVHCAVGRVGDVLDDLLEEVEKFSALYSVLPGRVSHEIQDLKVRVHEQMVRFDASRVPFDCDLVGLLD